VAKRTYHHGDLRRTLLDAAADAIKESGPAALSLRDLSRRAGVSHAAPTHHFGDKAGLLTALAAEGFDLLATHLAATPSFLERGVAYVTFATTHQAHFEVMFQPTLYHPDDPALQAARTRAGELLYSGVADLPDAESRNPRAAGLAGWSLAHGFATLWLSGALPDMGDDPAEAARAILRELSH
jgi:AcrR family transcriptional regulator